MQQPRWVDAAAVRRIVSPDRARRLIRCELADGLDPASDPARMVAGVADGQLLVMPATKGRVAGVKVVSTVKLFSHLANIGDTRSLIIHPASTTHKQLSDAQKTTAGAGPDVVRLSVGIEDKEDIIADLEQALAGT